MNVGPVAKRMGRRAKRKLAEKIVRMSSVYYPKCIFSPSCLVESFVVYSTFSVFVSSKDMIPSVEVCRGCTRDLWMKTGSLSPHTRSVVNCVNIWHIHKDKDCIGLFLHSMCMCMSCSLC